VFGHSGHELTPNGSVITNFVHHVNPFTRPDGVLKQVKMIIRPRSCLHYQIHGCDETAPGTKVVNVVHVRSVLTRVQAFAPFSFRCVRRSHSRITSEES
jgi:hypothetical protein